MPALAPRPAAATPSIIWCPESTLQISNDCSCIGYAPSKRRRCTIRISQSNRSNVDAILYKISLREPEPEALRAQLLDLAHCALCVRYHQGQAVGIVDKWVARIQEAYPETEDDEEEEVVSVVSRSSSTTTMAISASSGASSVTTQTTASSTSTRFPRSIRTIPSRSNTSSSTRASLDPFSAYDFESESLRQTIATMQETLRMARGGVEDAQTLGNDEPDLVPVSASRVSSLDVDPVSASRVSTLDLDHVSASRVSTLDLPPPALATVSRVSTSDTSALSLSPQPSPPPSSPTAVIIPQPSHPSPCHLTHTPRRPLSPSCPICQDPMSASDSAAPVDWCKQSCGRSVHSACFERWRSACVAAGREASCVECRALWADCGCCCGGHAARRRAVEEGDECDVCSEEMGADAEELVWCKEGCGRSLHKECFEAWRGECELRGREVSCVRCRGVWVDCGCDDGENWIRG